MGIDQDNVAEVWTWWSWASCRRCGQALGSEDQEDLVDYLAEHQATYHRQDMVDRAADMVALVTGVRPAWWQMEALRPYYQLELEL